MEYVALATALLTALAAAGSVVEKWLTARKASSDLQDSGDFEKVRAEVEEAARNGENTITDQDQRAVQKLIIDPGLLQAMDEEMQREQAALRTVVRTGSPAEIDRAVEKAQRIICKHLKIVKDHNNQELPEGQMQNLWMSFQCEESAAEELEQ